MTKKSGKYDLGMPNPRTPEDNINLEGSIYRNLLKGRVRQSKGIRVITFLVGLMLFLPLIFALFNLITTPELISVLNIAFYMTMAIAGLFIMYRAFKK